MLGAERQACSAISAAAGSPLQAVVMRTWAIGASQCAQSPAVWALPLSLPGSDGVTISMQGKGRTPAILSGLP